MKECLRDRMIHNPLARGAYKVKFYVDVGVSQISWVTGKFPELMSFLYLAQYLGHPVPQSHVVELCLAVFAGIFLFGLLWNRAGFYHTEKYVNAAKDPVQAELLAAARIINRDDKRRASCKCSRLSGAGSSVGGATWRRRQKARQRQPQQHRRK